MNMSEHPDTEGLSAYFDGEAPEHEAHITSCESCRAHLASLQAVSQIVGAPVAGPDLGAIDSMITRAVAAGEGAHLDDLAPRRTRPDARRWVAAASVAAALVLAIGLAGVIGSRDGGGNTRTESASRPTATSAPTFGGGQLRAPSEVTGSGDSAISGGDLGVIADANQLASKVAPSVGDRSASAADNPVVGPPAASGSGPVPRAVGTRGCELEARSIDPSGGPLVYVANATYAGAPATVLGFAPPGGGRPISLFLMAQDGCRLLARATLP
ncbi:MAG TPA: zf-HC2 domain-containing protein [Acidimicrobiales bacterium]|jgi:anti-sigma factor RsiW